MMIEAVIWDFGGVLTTSPFEAFARYETERGLPADIIQRTNAPITWKMPGPNSSAPRSISKPSTNCSRSNRWHWAQRFAARTCCRCCRAI
jgi:hypothetical protein